MLYNWVASLPLLLRCFGLWISCEWFLGVLKHACRFWLQTWKVRIYSHFLRFLDQDLLTKLSIALQPRPKFWVLVRLRFTPLHLRGYSFSCYTWSLWWRWWHPSETLMTSEICLYVNAVSLCICALFDIMHFFTGAIGEIKCSFCWDTVQWMSESIWQSNLIIYFSIYTSISLLPKYYWIYTSISYCT